MYTDIKDRRARFFFRLRACNNGEGTREECARAGFVNGSCSRGISFRNARARVLSLRVFARVLTSIEGFSAECARVCSEITVYVPRDLFHSLLRVS